MKTITEAAKECEFYSIGNELHFTAEQINTNFQLITEQNKQTITTD